MNRSLRTLTLILLVDTAASACASGNNPPVENAVPQTPDASVKLSGGVLGVGVAYKWGRGTLNYQGKEYEFCIRGLALGDVGAASLEAQGEVFSLRSVSDFSGRYFAISSGFAVGRGGSVVLTKNGSPVNVAPGCGFARGRSSRRLLQASACALRRSLDADPPVMSHSIEPRQPTQMFTDRIGGIR